MSSTNAFTTAARGDANHDVGAKGAHQHKSTDNLMLDAFLGLKRTSTPEYIKTTIDELVRQIAHMPTEDRGLWLADLFRLWVHKRHPRTGEKEKLLGRTMFLALYDNFPETCLALVHARIFSDMAYWKDCHLIWGMIIEQPLDDKAKFAKYNPLIEAFRESMMSQRTEDLNALDVFVKPLRIRDIPKDDLIARLRVDGVKLPTLTWIGKYCVRESSAENKRLCWWVLDESNGRLMRQSHVSYMLRFSLKRRLPTGQYQVWGASESIPFGAKEVWRKLNAKLDEVLGVPEVKATLDRLDEIDPSKLPGEFTKRNIKFLLNEKVKKAPTDEEDATGNRRPDDTSRVDLRKRTREMFTDPSKMNVATLMPHEIAYEAYKSTSRAKIDYHNAAFDKKVIDMGADFDRIRAEMASAAGDVDAVAAAMASGRILGCADVSGSMMTEAGGASPNTPLDIAMGLVAFIARIAAEPYRGLAMTFTDVPSIYDLKVGGRPMTAKESITAMKEHVGYTTNYQGMHKALIELCVDNSVPESELPVLYIASDCRFDQMDPTLSSATTAYNYSTHRYDTPHGATTPAQRWATTHQTIMGMWIKAGYKKVPLMVYHNINVTQSGVQATQDFKGVILLTGRSEQVIKLVLFGEAAGEVEQEIVVDGVSTTVKVQNVTPYDTFRKAMELDHFALLERVLLGANEGAMKYITPETIGGYTATIAA
jgi:hypothetical protein